MSSTHCESLSCDSCYPSDGTPLQDQVEQVEDALQKALAVIVELRNDVYQAQVDAQDWQNKYNAAVKTLKDVRDALPRRYDGLYLESAALALHEDLIKAEEMAVPAGAIYTTANLRRITELTEQNTQLELRNERQAEIITNALRGAKDIQFAVQGYCR